MTGWSLKRIQYEESKRKWGGFEDADSYHPARDLAKQQDWEWAVERLARRLEISNDQRSAAYRFYEAQQTMLGDVAPDPRGIRLTTTEDRYTRAQRIFSGALNYLFNHPDITPLRHQTFDKLFDVRQPTLEEVRTMSGRRTNQREAIARVRWCVEVLANYFDDAPYPQKGADVNEKHMGVGEGWMHMPYTGGTAEDCVRALEGQGLQTFIAPSGNVYARNPHAASVFQPLDATPQIAASKP